VQVNFYTSNSKVKENIKLTFVLILLLFVLIHSILNYAVSLKTTKNSFVSNIHSKTKHMQLNTSKATDIIFIGNSRTFFHISTKVFKENGLNIYNYGVSDRTIYNYTFMTKEAIKQHPKVIVLSLKISDIFEENNYLNRVALSDILAMIKTDQNFSLIKKAIEDYIHFFYSLVDYSDVINIKVQSLYNKFEPKVIVQSTNNKKGLSTKREDIKKSDCKVFDIKFPKNMRTEKCTNGDGILFGNSIEAKNIKKNFSKLNKEYIHLLNYIVNMIKKENIQPIIVFEPLFHTKIDYNTTLIDEIDSDIIDLTTLYIEDSMWVDNNHLNNKGRTFYSKYLSQKLKEIIDENSSF
jgi:hypothetical protein